MKVINQREEVEIYFASVSEGEVFLFDEIPYIKIPSLLVKSPLGGKFDYNAVNLSDGKPIYFENEEKIVIPNSAELYIK